MSQKDIWRYIHIRWAGRRNHCSFVSIYGTMGVDGRRADGKKGKEKKPFWIEFISARQSYYNPLECAPFLTHNANLSTRAIREREILILIEVFLFVFFVNLRDHRLRPSASF